MPWYWNFDVYSYWPRCGFCTIRRARPDHFFPPPPTVGPQRCRQRVAWSHGFTFPRVPNHVALMCQWRSPTSRARHPRLPASKNSPSQPWSGHHSSTALTSYAHVMLRSMQSWSKTNSGIQQNAVNKQISKGRKMNPNLNVLLEVWIFKLHLTSLFLPCGFFLLLLFLT